MTATVDPAALDLAECLAELDHVRSVCVLGSTARGRGAALSAKLV
jgi:hypothetical protein